MCGIIGCNWEDRGFLEKGMNAICHRGPDDSGMFFDKGVSLGHRRLSIIDLSAKGRQPMSNENRSVWIVFNGEIYNYKKLREKLRGRHEFKSNTDTEILIHLYEERGFDMLKELQGMFAFCIYDSVKRIFFVARDRAGIKPLYYHAGNEKFLFCSEIKGLLEYYGLKRVVNKDALSSFLAFRANTKEETMFKGIKKLMPGHFFVYELENNRFWTRKYWDVSFDKTNGNERFFKTQLFCLLDDAVNSYLVADVPYGAYLSGGVDSGTVVSLMNKYAEGRVKTFSVGFAEEEGKTELSAAKELAEKLGTEHHELIIDRNAVKHLPNIIYQSDEPMADPTSIPTYLLSKYTKQKGVSVVLTGEGADELFAGYPQYKFMKMREKILSKIPSNMRKIFPFVLKHTPDYLLNKGFKFASALGEKGIERFSNFLMANRQSEQYLQQLAIFNEKEQDELLKTKTKLYERYDKYFCGERQIVGKCQMLDFKEPMVDDLLMKVDKNTMAFSVEARVPFLEHRVIELANKIPDGLKLKGFGKDKYILRESMKNLIPERTRKRKKRHFFVPIDSWFNDELSALTKELLNEQYVRKQKIFNPRYIKKIWNGLDRSRLFYARQLWCLLGFQIWHRQYIENGKIKI